MSGLQSDWSRWSPESTEGAAATEQQVGDNAGIQYKSEEMCSFCRLTSLDGRALEARGVQDAVFGELNLCTVCFLIYGLIDLSRCITSQLARLLQEILQPVLEIFSVLVRPEIMHKTLQYTPLGVFAGLPSVIFGRVGGADQLPRQGAWRKVREGFCVHLVTGIVSRDVVGDINHVGQEHLEQAEPLPDFMWPSELQAHEAWLNAHRAQSSASDSAAASAGVLSEPPPSQQEDRQVPERTGPPDQQDASLQHPTDSEACPRPNQQPDSAVEEVARAVDWAMQQEVARAVDSHLIEHHSGIPPSGLSNQLPAVQHSRLELNLRKTIIEEALHYIRLIGGTPVGQTGVTAVPPHLMNALSVLIEQIDVQLAELKINTASSASTQTDVEEYPQLRRFFAHGVFRP